jgi:hypothetical protein
MHTAKLWEAGRTPALCGSNLTPWDSTSHDLRRDDYSGSNPALGTCFFRSSLNVGIVQRSSTPPFHGGNTGSNPVTDANILLQRYQTCCICSKTL